LSPLRFGYVGRLDKLRRHSFNGCISHGGNKVLQDFRKKALALSGCGLAKFGLQIKPPCLFYGSGL
jgi:hypothetical protein